MSLWIKFAYRASITVPDFVHGILRGFKFDLWRIYSAGVPLTRLNIQRNLIIINLTVEVKKQ